MAIRADVIVLGAGMVGVGAALALQARGRDVALIDRRGAAGRETSYGNAGLIERAIGNLKWTLLEESLIVAAVCVIFLLHVRSALVAIITLPSGEVGSFSFWTTDVVREPGEQASPTEDEQEPGHGEEHGRDDARAAPEERRQREDNHQRLDEETREHVRASLPDAP